MSKRGGKREGAGRKPASVDSIIRTQRDRVDTDAIIDFLNDVASGKPVKARLMTMLDDAEPKIGSVVPTIEHRMKASEMLLKKTLPDLKAVEHSGYMAVTDEATKEQKDAAVRAALGAGS